MSLRVRKDENGELWVYHEPYAGSPFPSVPEKQWNTVVRRWVDKQKCECGAFKASGIKCGEKGHSSWCPWAIDV